MPPRTLFKCGEQDMECLTTKARKKQQLIPLGLRAMALLAVLGLQSQSFAASSPQWLTAKDQQFPLTVSKNRKSPLLGRAVVLVPQLAEQRNSRSILAIAKQIPADGWHSILLPVDAALKGEVSDTPTLSEDAGQENAENLQAESSKEEPQEAAPESEGTKEGMEGEEPAGESQGRAKKVIKIANSLTLLDRLSTSLEGLPETSAANTIIIAGREHALQVMKLIATQELAAPAGLVMIDAVGELDSDQQAEFFSGEFSVLDLTTLLESKRAGEERKNRAAENNHTDYRFINLPPPAPNWSAGRDRLTQRVRGWLKQRWGQN